MSLVLPALKNADKAIASHRHNALFRSFWMGGYEGADHLNSRGVALDANTTNGHWQQLGADYARLAATGIRTIRESIGWRASTNAHGKLDSAMLRQRADIAQAHGLQVIWTLHHYGVPPGVNFFAADFAERFADFCDAASRALHGATDGPAIYQPINEISFLSWAVSYSNLMHPFDGNSPQGSYELKCRLVAAALRGCDAIWANEAEARIVHTDPIVHIVAVPGASADELAQVHSIRQHQFEAWDMICGKTEPALGGAPRYLDILGVNYYHDNQWEHPSHAKLDWHLKDARRCSLEHLLGQVWARYGRPLFISETGHVGAGRSVWFEDVARAAVQCLANGVPLQGVCLYPLVDRTDWETPERWHRCGLWDVVPRPSLKFPEAPEVPVSRALHEPLAQRLQYWQTLFSTGNTQVAEFLTQPEVHMSPLIVFSHLRWDFVYQRPQQLLSRLAAGRPVIFIEEPMAGAAAPLLERMQPCRGVQVLRCHVTGDSRGFTDDNFPAMKMLLAQYVAEQDLNDYWLWFYTPMALPLAAVFKPAGVVYDCMDELSAFKNAPRELLLREDQLFAIADLVFTGGHSLYEAKSQRHPNVSCFPSSVDAAHYARPQTAEMSASQMAAPRLGYCGVIDERIDIELIAALADARPDWEIVMVGPVVKIDPASLPSRANIKWLGQQDYADLPGLIHSWNVCLMPFALNEATRFISPTKTLEYLAAGCPVVSTPIRDVVTSYPHIVAIADTPEKFVLACAAALSRNAEQIALEASAVQQMLERTSWDRTANAMASLMADYGKAAVAEFEEREIQTQDAEGQASRLPLSTQPARLPLSLPATLKRPYLQPVKPLRLKSRRVPVFDVDGPGASPGS